MAAGNDWTTGPAKWFAVIALGVLSAAALAWSVFQSRAAYPPVVVPAASAQPASPAVAPTIVRTPGASATPAPKLQPEPVSVALPVTPAAQVAHLIRINSASAAELELLPGIGPAMAKRIIDDREAHGPFKSVDELTRVRGIGPKTLQRVRDKITVE